MPTPKSRWSNGFNNGLDLMPNYMYMGTANATLMEKLNRNIDCDHRCMHMTIPFR